MRVDALIPVELETPRVRLRGIQLDDWGALVEKTSGAVMGAAGLWCPGDFPEAEIKWLLLPEFWGRGFASEAVRKIQEISLQHLGLQPISLIVSGNERSRRLASAVGATHERDVPFRGESWMAYRHPARKTAP